MVDYTIQELEQKFMNAHNAGDTRSAKLLKNMIVEQESGASITQKAWERPDGGFTFDKLDQNDQYTQDLKDDYKDREGTDFKGDVNELKENNFEYWNSSLLNELSLADTALSINSMDDKQKARTLRMFNTFDNTDITGEGSRDLWEQTKDAGALLWAPSTYLGGKFIAGGAMHAAGKTGIKKLLSGLGARSAAVSGAITGAQDVGIQKGIEMQLDEDQEFDIDRAATATALGSAMGGATPSLIKGAGKLLKGAGKTAEAVVKPISTLKKAGGGIVKTFGGGEAATEGVVQTSKGILDDAIGLEGKSEASASLSESLRDVIKSGGERFTARFDDLGELSVSAKEVENLVDGLQGKAAIKRIGNLDTAVEAMKSGDLTPTQALRKVRSGIGKEMQSAKRGVGSNTSSDQVLHNFYDKSRSLFKNAAMKSGKAKEAATLDKDYSKFLNVKNKKSITGAQEDVSAATRKLNQAISSKNPHKVVEFFKEMDELGKAAGDVNFGDVQRDNLQKVLSEHLFTGQTGAPLRKFLGDKSGVEVLQEVFEGKVAKETWKSFADILENAHDHKGIGLFMSKLLAGSAGALTGGGPLGAAGGFLGMEKIIKSKTFQRIAMQVFSGNPKKKSIGSSNLEKFLSKQGLDGSQVDSFMDLVVGTTGIGTAKAVTTNRDND